MSLTHPSEQISEVERLDAYNRDCLDCYEIACGDYPDECREGAYGSTVAVLLRMVAKQQPSISLLERSLNAR
jgi:hypothetical protein